MSLRNRYDDVLAALLGVVDQLKLNIGTVLLPEDGAKVVVFVVSLDRLLETDEELFELFVRNFFEDREATDSCLEEQVSEAHRRVVFGIDRRFINEHRRLRNL